MQTRYRAAATALLLTATAGLAATGGAAEASGTHHTSARAGAKILTITVKSEAKSLKLSDTTIRPGRTVFRVKNIDGKASRGLIQLLRLRAGYTAVDASNDIPAAFNGDTAAVKRVDDGIVFYGGMPAKGDKSTPPTQWAVNLGKPGRYVMVNFDHQIFASLTVAGAKEKRGFPARTGFINAVTSSNAAGNDFEAGKGMPHLGWMSTRNSAEEPHFVELQQVKKGTTDADISRAFKGGPDPSVHPGGHASTGIISPGHRFVWTYRVPAGRYAAMCFFPSQMNGVPHALMGMHTVFNLH